MSGDRRPTGFAAVRVRVAALGAALTGALTVALTFGLTFGLTVAMSAGMPADAWAANSGAVSLSPDGRTLLKDCRPWAPRGLSFFGRVSPTGFQVGPDTAAAHAEFSRWIVDAVRTMGGDTARFQVGLPFLDPQQPQYSPRYVGELREAVAMARGSGLVVVLSLQWEARTNVAPVEKIPHDAALRAWRTLAPAFADDPGVVFELFNEPGNPGGPDAAEWQSWRAGHQAIIDDMRAHGVRNTLWVDGMVFGRQLDGSPPLIDPLRRTAYAVHPYFAGDMVRPIAWDNHFGRFAATHAVVASEWSHMANMCRVGDGHVVDQLMDYLAARHIGLVGYGADESAGRLIEHDGIANGRFQVKNFRDHPCEGVHSGPGEAIQRLFARLAEQDARAQPVAACVAP